MAKVSMSTELGATAAEVWELIGDFNGLPDWNADVERSVLEKGGRLRRLSIADGSTLVEQLERMDDKARSCTYTITEGDPSVRNYRATIRVIDKGERCQVEWSSTFDPVDDEATAVEAVRGIYGAGFAGLKKIFGA